MNRVERWFKRNDSVSLERKMKEWGTTDRSEFFSYQFEDKLTISELLTLKYIL